MRYIWCLGLKARRHETSFKDWSKAFGDHCVPYVTHQNGFHYCELCDASFIEAPVTAGQHLRMVKASSEAKWEGCPGPRLRFQAGERHHVAAVRQASGGAWFFKTQAKVRGRAASGDDGGSARPQFLPLWAPLSATDAAGWPTPLAAHLASESHRAVEAAVVSGERLLVSRAALSLSKALGERPSTSHSRFLAGLGIAGVLCTPEDLHRARRLERVRDAEVPAKFLRDFVPSGQARELLWMSPETMQAAVDAYEQKQKTAGRRGAARRGREQAQKCRAESDEALEAAEGGGVLASGAGAAEACGKVAA